MSEPQNPGTPFFNALTGFIPGYVVGLCGHRVADSEWTAGARVCERCVADDYRVVGEAVEWLAGTVLSGSLTRMRAAELLADWEYRADLSEAEVRLVLDRYPDPHDYEALVVRAALTPDDTDLPDANPGGTR